ncbi:MAG: nuclear transport factor 2 family protein [bacterium]|nr:nuclear transport factor 2 family protein [bacterium]
MATDRPATDTVLAYFDRIRSRDPGVADLFHASGALIGLGRVTSGREAIRAFYAESIANASPTPELVGELLASGPRVAAEIRIALADGTSMHVVDLFEVEAGLIRSLTYFVADH